MKNEGVHYSDSKTPPYEPFSTGSKMKRGKNSKIFDNNGGDSKAQGGGTVN